MPTKPPMHPAEAIATLGLFGNPLRKGAYQERQAVDGDPKAHAARQAVRANLDPMRSAELATAAQVAAHQARTANPPKVAPSSLTPNENISPVREAATDVPFKGGGVNEDLFTANCVPAAPARPPSTARSPTRSVASKGIAMTNDTIAAIDASIAALSDQERPIREAIARARAIISGAVATAVEKTVKRGSFLADFFMGTSKPRELDRLKSHAADAAQEHEDAVQAQEDARIAVTELEARLVPIQQQRIALGRQRDVAVRQDLREQAEQAARDYMAAVDDVGLSYAHLCALGQELRRMDATVGGLPLAFTGDQPQPLSLPAPDVGVLAGNVSRLSVVFHKSAVQTGREVFIDFADMQREVAALVK